MDIEKPATYRYDECLPKDSALLSELLKGAEIEQVFEAYYNLTAIAFGIIDLNANVLFSSRWQRICTQFHRVHPITCSRCIESDTHLARQLSEGKTYSIYTCRNGLTDCTSPIMIEGRHVANCFIGQFFIKKPDKAFFHRQAEEFGFDIGDYIAALHEVPIVEEEKVPAIHNLLTRMTRLITKLSMERKRAIENHARQSIILDTIPQSIFWKDLQGKYLGCNAPFARAAGLKTPDDIVGKTDFDLPWRREDTEAYRADDQAVISANKSRLHIIEPLQQADGSHLIVDTSKIPLVDAGNLPYGLVGIYEDVTDRKRAEEELKAREKRLESIFRAAPVSIIFVRDQKIIEANERFFRMLGYTQEELLGASTQAIYPTEADFHRVERDLYTRLAKKNVVTLECPLKHKEGSIVNTLTSASFLDPDKPDKGMVAFILDITDRIKLENQLRQALKMESVGRLAGGVAHDFNNMLSVILGNIELALEDLDTSKSLHGNLEVIRNAALRSADLTRQLLAFSRQQAIAPKPLNLNNIVDDMLKLLRRLLGEDIDLIWLPDKKLWQVNMDPAQVDQILANLCVNARDAIPGQGKITIETNNCTLDEGYCINNPFISPGAYVILSVSDNGSGMDERTKAQIFEPFFTTKKAGSGTGLGLATIYGIVKQNGGFINVYSEVGKGTTFRIYLPCYEVREKAVKVETAQPKFQGGSETILLVEDEILILELCRKMLESLGYRLLCSSTPLEALKIAREYEGSIDLLITDVVMPEMNGKELAGLLEIDRPGLKTLYLSGYTADVIARHGILDGSIHFLSKPFSKKDLDLKVREIFS